MAAWLPRCPSRNRRTAQALPSLTSLALNHSAAVDADLTLALPQLKSLDVFATEIDDATVARLVSSCPALETLRIGCSGVTDDSLPFLNSLPSLTELSVASCAISDAAAAHLAALPHLASLDLNGCTPLTDHGLRKIAQTCTALVDLWQFDDIQGEEMSVAYTMAGACAAESICAARARELGGSRRGQTVRLRP